LPIVEVGILEQAFELLRKGLTENYLAAELAQSKMAGVLAANGEEDLMAGLTLEDFLGPDMAKTSK